MSEKKAPLIPIKDLEHTLRPFLANKELYTQIEEWLQDDFGLTAFRAKFITKIFVPALEKLLTGTLRRGLERVHDTLRNRYDFYNDLTVNIGSWLFYKVESAQQKKHALEKHLSKPDSVSKKAWATFSDQTRVWLDELSTLHHIDLALGDLNANIILDFEKPHLLNNIQPSRWLRPYNAFIDMKGRDLWMKKLAEFCDDDDPFQWMVIIGDGGIGKTRLAHEFVKSMNTECWNAGFLSQDGLKQLVCHDGFSNWGPLVNTLIVVDYAASKTSDLKDLLCRAARWAKDNEGDINTSKLRLLLLERHATQEEGWLNEVLRAGEGGLRDRILDALSALSELGPPGTNVSLTDTMIEILRLTCTNWSSLTGTPAPILPKFDENSISHFWKVTEGRPIFIQMAGIHACETGNPLGLVKWVRSDLIKASVDRERDYIQMQCTTIEPTYLVERAAAILTLAGSRGREDQDWLKLLSEDTAACGYHQTQVGAIVDALRDILGEEDIEGIKVLSPIRPDLLGEAFAVNVLMKNEKILPDTIRKLLDLAGLDAWSRLLRATIDLFDVEGFQNIEEWIIPLLHIRPTQELLGIESLVLKQTVALRRFGTRYYEILLERLSDKPELAPDRARILNNLGALYSNLGKREEALDATKRAVKIYERLAVRNPDAFEPDLAGSLNNLGNRYSNLGKREEALDATKRAVKIRERLAGRNPDAFEPDLAMSLGAKGSICVKMRSPEKAINAFYRGIGVLRRVFMNNDQAFEQLMRNLVQGYIESCKAAGVVPDVELLGPIIHKFKEGRGNKEEK